MAVPVAGSQYVGGSNSAVAVYSGDQGQIFQQYFLPPDSVTKESTEENQSLRRSWLRNSLSVSENEGLGKTERGEQIRDIDLTSLRSTMPASGPLQGGSHSNLNMNLYATKKTASEGMLDIALFLANITHMKTVIEQGAGYRYYVAVLVLISFSLALQIVAGVLIIIIARRDINEEANQKRLDSLNNTITIIIFLIFVTNIFITVFGMERTGLFARMHY
ncbi:hypothetical protein NQZ68_021179 [Dissostichus eleginoides]|nr:hypothetical protein NQZ68_021179 [Dissostichus eleginoides]